MRPLPSTAVLTAVSTALAAALLFASAPLAAQEKISVKKAWARLDGRGQIDALRRDLAENKAVDLLVERAKVITVAQAKKAGTAWTPTRAEQDENPDLWNV